MVYSYEWAGGSGSLKAPVLFQLNVTKYIIKNIREV